MPNNYVPFKYQEDGVFWLKSARKTDLPLDHFVPPRVGVIGDEPGLGKTAQGLLTLREEILAGKRYLFLVPGATIIQWQKNFDRWILDCEPDPFCTTSLYAVRSSDQNIPRGVNVVMSHSMLAKEEMVRKIIAANFDGVLIDEIHKFGSEGTKRIKNLRTAQNLSDSKWEDARIGLSGTIVRNYAKELYNIAHFLDPLRYRTMEDFARNHLTWDRKALINPVKFHKEFAPYYLRRTVSEVQKDLPPVRITPFYTEITDPLVRAAYNKNVDLLSNFMNNAGKIDAFSLLGYLVRLRHITGVAKANEPSIIEPIKDYLEDGGKPVIGIHHHFVATRLMKALQPNNPILIRGGMTDQQKENAKQEFISAPSQTYALLSIKAAGEGIDGLQYASNKGYIFEPQWNMAEIKQLVKRLHRTGQTKPVHFEWTMAVGTVDEFFYEMSVMKDNIAGAVEDVNYEANPGFLKDLAQKVISSRLPEVTKKDYELLDRMGIKYEMEESLDEQHYIGETEGA